MKDLLIKLGTALLMIILVIFVWIIMTAFNMSYAIVNICANTPKVVNKVISNKERFISLFKTIF